MTTALQTRNSTDADAWGIMERVIIVGDLAKLDPQERVLYYRQVCESVGLNPLTRPFDYITLNNKLTLYARKEATDQLREINGVSIFRIEEQTLDGVHRVRAYARVPDGREDTALGAVTVDNLRGEALANALMKAETKAKRRVTLSICGLGWLDETEIETISTARPITVSVETGEITDAPAKQAPRATERPATPSGVPSPASGQAAASAPRVVAAAGDAAAPVPGEMPAPQGDTFTRVTAALTVQRERLHLTDDEVLTIMKERVRRVERIGQASMTDRLALLKILETEGRAALPDYAAVGAA